MYRSALSYLHEWKNKRSRKPLVIRGARQVGKSYLVQMFANDAFENIIEINFERHSNLRSLFASNDIHSIVQFIEVTYNISVVPGKTLLFFDEIQAAPEVFATLRYFYEDIPGLHIIAAGSLLEFVLENHEFSMPVGRIEYLHLGPLTFDEFLLALDRNQLSQFLNDYHINDLLPEAIHLELMKLFRQYLIIGGMPEAVCSYANTHSYLECDIIQQSLISTYRNDFNKYAGHVHCERLEKVFLKVPHVVGKKFKYTHIDREEKSRDLKQALHLLILSRVIMPVYHSSCNGIPLGAEASDRCFKLLFLDVGLLNKSMGVSAADLEKVEDLNLVNMGAVCEQFIGQHLLYSAELFKEPEIFYWMREKKNSNAKVDYILLVGQRIIPIEVKAGKVGTLKSLHMYMMEKKCHIGLRFNSDIPSLTPFSLNDYTSPLHLLSLPHYMVGQSKRLLREMMKGMNDGL